MHNSVTEELFLEIDDEELRLSTRRLVLDSQLTTLIFSGEQMLDQTHRVVINEPHRKPKGERERESLSIGTCTEDCDPVMPCVLNHLQSAKVTVEYGRVSRNYGFNLLEGGLNSAGALGKTLHRWCLSYLAPISIWGTI